MGLLDAFGDKINPGLLSGIRSLGALSGFDEGNVVPLRMAMEQQTRDAKDRELKTQRQNQTAAYLRKQGQNELANAVELGLVDSQTAFKTFYEEANAKPLEINGQLVDPNTYQVLGDYRTPEIGKGDAYTLGPGQVRYDAAGNVIARGPEKSQDPMNATTQKELFDADEGIQAGEAVATALDKALLLNESAWDGPAADIGTQAGALFGDQNSVATQELKNLVTAQALDQLKATFGAMPTEGERKILLEIQGSVTQPREVRKRIFERAKEAVKRRVEFNRKKAEGLRSGSYFQEGFDPFSAESGGNKTSTGVQWSYEP